MSAPAVAVSASGKKFAAAWKDVSTGEPNVYWAISDKPEFDEGRRVHDETRGKQDHPSLCLDACGVVWVAWEDSRSGQQKIWIRSSRASDAGRPLGDVNQAAASFPTIATGQDLVAVVYESQHQDRQTIQFCLVSATQ